MVEAETCLVKQGFIQIEFIHEMGFFHQALIGVVLAFGDRADRNRLVKGFWRHLELLSILFGFARFLQWTSTESTR
jgi:hypothetical protein